MSTNINCCDDQIVRWTGLNPCWVFTVCFRDSNTDEKQELSIKNTCERQKPCLESHLFLCLWHNGSCLIGLEHPHSQVGCK